MKAIRVTRPFEVEIVEIPKPEITGKEDVIIKVTSGGICGSDIGIWNGTNSLATYPRIIGHEFGGIVVQTGEEVTKVKVGDKVSVDPVISCKKCYACQIGRHNVCVDLEVMGVHRDGGFSEYVKAPEENIYKCSDDVEEKYLGLVEPFTIGVEINRRAEIKEGDKVLIMGAGPIGVCAMQVAKKNGARVMMTDVVEARLKKATEMGADETVLVSEENLEQRIFQYTNGEGVPVVIDTICQPFSFEASVDYASQAGRVVVIGLKNEAAAIKMADITKKELTIVGSRLNNHCFSEVIEGFAHKTLQPEMLLTKEFHFTEIETALELIREKPEEVLKIVLKFETQKINLR